MSLKGKLVQKLFLSCLIEFLAICWLVGREEQPKLVWASPIVPVPKPGGSTRSYIDYK